MKMETIRNGDYRNDRNLVAALHGIIAPRYEDPTAILERELTKTDTLYLAKDDMLAKDDNNSVLAFFAVGWEMLRLGNQVVRSVYLGLSAVRNDVTDHTIMTGVYKHFNDEAAGMEWNSGERLLLWFTCATPGAYLGASHAFSDLEPRVDGSFSEEGRVVALAIAEQKFAYKEGVLGDHPLLLRGVASRTLYSSEEAERIAKISKEKRFALLRLVGVEERQHGGMIVICRVNSKRNV